MKIKVDMRGIDQLPSGTFRIRVQYKGEKLSETAQTLPEALSMRDDLRQNGRSRSFIKGGEVTIRTWGPEWLKKYRRDKEGYKGERSRFEKHVLPDPMADKPLTNVTPDDIEIWCSRLAAKFAYEGDDLCERDPVRLSFSSRKHCLDLVRALFKDARRPENGFVKYNPAADIAFKKTKEEIRKQKVSIDWPLKSHEIVEHLDSFGDLWERWISGASLGTAMRQGEQWRLKIADVHLGGSQPYIFIRGGKTVESTRRIPLFGLGLESFEHWMEVLGRYAPRNPEGLVFPTPVRVKPNGELHGRGGNQRPRGAPPFFKVRRMLPTRQEAIWWHLYRHTCATSLLSGIELYGGVKWDLQEVSKLLGHASVKTTEMYAHFLDSALMPVVQRTQEGWVRRQEIEARQRLRLVG